MRASCSPSAGTRAVRVVRAEVLGFCHGVRRAVERVEEAVADHGTVFSLGPVVHNEQVTARLARVGVKVVQSLDEVPDGGVVAVTAHGAEAETLDRIAERGLPRIDATCPIVRRAQQAAAEHTAAGRTVIVYGDPAHPEVRGILSRTGGRGVATESADLMDASIEPPIALLAQTTADPEGFERFVGAVRARSDGDITVVDTTCPETVRRYRAARDLAARVDGMVVVGSRSSANTVRLVDVCRAADVPTFLVASADEIGSSMLGGFPLIGLTAGASTPDAIIDEVLRCLRRHRL